MMSFYSSNPEIERRFFMVKGEKRLNYMSNRPFVTQWMKKMFCDCVLFTLNFIKLSMAFIPSKLSFHVYGLIAFLSLSTYNDLGSSRFDSHHLILYFDYNNCIELMKMNEFNVHPSNSNDRISVIHKHWFSNNHPRFTI